MHRVYILCAMCVVVYGNSDETKYIDLLPEAEKQEFLNRIARRIIEEIQGKDPPEQSHAEVSDDQLNVHHTYVQDLIKEESQNLRNERRKNFNDTYNVERKADNEEVEKENISEEQNNPGVNENSQHIDLTLRNDRLSEEESRKLSDESAFSVIPVKVFYDKKDIEITESPKSNASVQHQLIAADIEGRRHVTTESSHYNDSGNYSINTLQPVINQSDIKSTNNISEVTKNQPENTSNNDIEVFTTDKQNVSANLERSSTENPAETNATLMIGVRHDNISNSYSFNNTKSSIKIYNTSDESEITDISPTEADIKLSDTSTTTLPLTTEMYIQSDSNSPKSDQSNAIIYITTSKRKKGNLNGKSDIDTDTSTAHNMKDISEVEPNKIIKNNVAKNSLRTRLETIPKEYEMDVPQKKIYEPKQNDDNNIKQYLVYEVPEEKPIFVRKTKYSKQNEEPYVIPIYDFAPKNAYYNAYNRFGVNNDEENKIIDKKLNLKNGFDIELNTKDNNYRKDKKVRKEYFVKHSHHPHWEHILNSKFRNNPNLVKYQDYENLRRKIKGEDKKAEKLYSPSKIPATIKYIPLRHRSESDYDDRVGQSENKKLQDGKFPHASERGNTGEAKTIWYQQKFSYLNPSTYERVIGENYGLKYSNDKRKGNVKTTPKDIELDYYFEKYQVNNRTGEIDYSNEYVEIKDQKPKSAEHLKFYDFTNKKDEESITKYRMDVDNCEFGCIEMDAVTGHRSDKYLDALVEVFKDMIYRDKADLVNYNWLLSTVDLESALKKLMDLTTTIEEGHNMHPLDLELLNYILHLYNTSSYKLENTIQPRKQSQALQDISYIVNSFLKLLRRRIALPKNKNRKPGHKLTNPIQYWYKYYIRDGVDDNDMRTANLNDLRSFKMFLNDLKDNLFEFHDAVKQIALISTYDDQSWYADLKNIYLKSATNKQLTQVILHLATSRLFSSIEETAKKAEEDRGYVNNNGEVVRRLQEEFVLVLKVLERIKRLK